MTSWEIEGRELINGNCSYGCPCQFNALPTHGYCEAIGAFTIDRGHHGDVPLDGPKAAMILHWPGPIHEGGGRCQPIVDAAADERQRGALLRILSRQDKEHRARIELPNGFEYEVAEIGSASGRSSGNAPMEFENGYAQFARLHLPSAGAIRHRASS